LEAFLLLLDAERMNVRVDERRHAGEMRGRRNRGIAEDMTVDLMSTDDGCSRNKTQQSLN
jgi:hypothetical protein